MSENTHGWLGLLMLILALVCAFMVAEQRDDLKQEAVKRGFAEWIVTGQNQTEFKWKEKQ
jgi:hypothetical protein